MRNAISFSMILLLWGCSERIADNPVANKPPRTFISIFSENDLSSTISRQTLHWWGDDPDGIIAGYVYTFNPDAPNVSEWDTSGTDADWTFTRETERTFILTLAGQDTTYTLWVKAVDDQGSADPTGAIQNFNIFNTVPAVEFPAGTDVPDTTFTVATFTWSGTDPDGDDTIDKYQYILDDTTDLSGMIDVDSRASSVTLTASDGLTQGDHVFYLRAVDVAGAVSRFIQMPRSSNDIWFVKEPRSDFLVVDDYNIADNTATFYQTTISNIIGGPVDVWDIKRNAGELEPPTAVTFRETLMLFKRIFWYADTGPNLLKAEVSLREFAEAGGKILMTTSFTEFANNQGDPLDFSPADSLGTRIDRITRGQEIIPTGDFAAQGFPPLQVSASIVFNVFPLIPKISSSVIYTFPQGDWGDPEETSPPICVINADKNFVFFGMPIVALDEGGNAQQLLQVLFNGILGE